MSEERPKNDFPEKEDSELEREMKELLETHSQTYTDEEDAWLTAAWERFRPLLDEVDSAAKMQEEFKRIFRLKNPDVADSEVKAAYERFKMMLTHNQSEN